MPRRERNPFVKRNETISIQIEDYAFGGKGIGRIRNEHGEFVVFVPNTLPGQLVSARIVKSRKKFAEAKLVEVLEPSQDEVEIPYQEIPGAPYIKLPVSIQHQYKKESTFSLFEKIGKVSDVSSKFDEFVSSPSHFHYRNKMEYGFSAIGFDRALKTDVDEFTLGFKKRGVWWLGENLDKDSGLFDEDVENHLKSIRIYCQNTGLDPWHGPRREGFFRYFVVRNSFKNNELLFNLVTTSKHLKQFDLQKFGTFLKELFKDRFAGLLHTINDETGDRTIATSGSVNLVLGKEKIIEEIRKIYDPELPVNIYELGLIYDIKVEGRKAEIKMTLTTPNCPVAESLPKEVKEGAMQVEEIDDVDLQLVWDPPWTKDMMSDAAKLELNL